MSAENQPLLELLVWLMLGVSFVVAALGTLLPGIPGAILIVGAVIIHKMILPEVFSWTLVFILSFLAIASWFVDFFGGVIGAKIGGSSRAGLIGATIGSLAFFFIGFPGLIIGPFCGAIVGDLYARRKNYLELLKSGIGASLGFFISLFLRFAILMLMAVMISFGILRFFPLHCIRQ